MGRSSPIWKWVTLAGLVGGAGESGERKWWRGISGQWGGVLGRSRPSIPWASSPWNQKDLIAKIAETCHSLDRPQTESPRSHLSREKQSEGPLLYHPWQQLEQSMELHLQRALCQRASLLLLLLLLLLSHFSRVRLLSGLPFDPWDWTTAHIQALGVASSCLG